MQRTTIFIEPGYYQFLREMADAMNRANGMQFEGVYLGGKHTAGSLIRHAVYAYCRTMAKKLWGWSDADCDRIHARIMDEARNQDSRHYNNKTPIAKEFYDFCANMNVSAEAALGYVKQELVNKGAVTQEQLNQPTDGLAREMDIDDVLGQWLVNNGPNPPPNTDHDRDYEPYQPDSANIGQQPAAAAIVQVQVNTAAFNKPMSGLTFTDSEE